MSYTTATVRDVSQESDSRRVQVNILYTGDAGELAVVLPVTVSPGATLDDIRGQAMTQIALLNTNRIAALGLVRGQVLDTTTALPVPPAPLVLRSYMAASAPFTPGATPQDVFSITGSANKTVTVVRAGLGSLQTTAGINTWHLLKRSTANTGGTSAAVASVPTNDAFTAATATVLQYTVNPTAGTLVGRVWGGRIPSPTVTLAAIGDGDNPLIFPEIMPIVLTGTTDVLAWNFNGVALPPGLSVVAYFWWTEI